MSEQPLVPGVNDPNSHPGEPGFEFGRVEVAPGLVMVVMKFSSTNGVTVQAVIRPALAANVARLLSEQAREASAETSPLSRLVIPKPVLPKNLNGDVAEGE